MSYYRYITGVYKSYWPGLNRTLRSSSVPRSVPDIDCGTYGLNISGLEGGLRLGRSTSMPPTTDYYSSSVFLSRHSATPFRDRSLSVIPSPLKYAAVTRSSVSRVESTHYTDFDCKVLDYMGQLDRQQQVRNEVSHSRIRETPDRYSSSSRATPDRFSSRYNYYDGNKHGEDYLYQSSKDVLGNWLVTGRSRDTLKHRNDRATSPLSSRGLDRYYGSSRRVDYMGDVSSGRTDFRHYNYRKVPYLGGSDYMKYIPKYFDYLNELPEQRFKYATEFK